MESNKPQILIGVQQPVSELVKRTCAEILYGIEEEGCLYQVYKAESAGDIRYSATGVTIMLTEEEASLHWADLKENQPLYSIESGSAACQEMRNLGKNAARFLKQRPLEL